MDDGSQDRGAAWGAPDTKEGDMVEPRIRAGDADRGRVVAQLGRHLGEGRLDVSEFDDRVTRTHAAVYLDELPPLLADLPADPSPARQPARRPDRADRAARAAVPFLIAMVLAWSVVAMVNGVPPFLGLLVLVLFLRNRRWSGRW
jgi:hypothetical protein